MTSNDCPFLASPASTLPITTVPISLYLSTIGIIKGPLLLRLSEGSESMKGMNGGPLYQLQRCSGIGSFKPIPS